MQNLMRYSRFAVRQLWKNSVFTLVAVLTLGLGIGVNVAIFSLINAVLLRSIAKVRDPNQLVMIWESRRNSGFLPFSYPDYTDYKDKSQSFSGIIAWRPTSVHLSSDDMAERIAGALVSANFFSVLGVDAVVGRTFLPEEGQISDSHAVAVISHSLWKRRFNSDINIVGKGIVLNSHSFTVVGVAPEGFRGTDLLEVTDIWIPIVKHLVAKPESAKWMNERDTRWLRVLGRLKPGVNFDQARVEMNTLARQLEQAYPQTNAGVGILLDAKIGLIPDDKAALTDLAALLLSVVGAVLLIACANISNLQMVRVMDRSREISIRLALGATRREVIQQLTIESLVLSLLAGLAGLLFAYLGSDLLLALIPPSNNSTVIDLKIDIRVLVFALTLCLITSVLFGLVPAFRASRPDLITLLKNSSAGQSYKRSRLRNMLVISQIALSLILLIGAGLFIRSLRKVEDINPGFEAKNVVTMFYDLGPQKYSVDNARRFSWQLTERIAAIPGVEAVSAANLVPLTGMDQDLRVIPEGREAPSKGTGGIAADYNVVQPGYFRTLNIALTSGRDFGAEDVESAPGVAIINQTLARKLWPNENPVGKRLALLNQAGAGPYLQVIGVANNSKYRSMIENPRSCLYLPFSQNYEPAMALFVRTGADPTGFVNTLRSEIRAVDKNLPIYNITTLSQVLENSLWEQRMIATLLVIFSFLALSVATIGIYGVISYTVTQRTQEIGIRMALGAQLGDVTKLIVRQGLIMAAIGISVGLAGGGLLTQLVSSFLYGVSPTDPITFAGISILMLIVTLVASFIPARRTARIDPTGALKRL
jgi:predicted permease